MVNPTGQTATLPSIIFPRPRIRPVVPVDSPALAEKILDELSVDAMSISMVGFLAEVASLGQIESVTAIALAMMHLSGAPKIVSDLNTLSVEIGLKTRLTHYYNSVHMPNIPDPATLTKLYCSEQITRTAFQLFMGWHGFDTWAADTQALAAYKYPDVNTVMELLRRDIIKDVDFDALVKWGGIHPLLTPTLRKLRWQLPGYQDIISVYMREGYLPEKWVEIPGEFKDYMSQLGYSNDWALRLWGKHWVLPGVNLLYDMFHKKIIDYGTMTQMLKYHDFEPVWRQRLLDNAYNMIPRVDLRRAYRYKMLSGNELKERYEWLGFKPSDALIMSGIALRTSLDRYYTRLETVARAAFRKGKLSETAFKSVLARINTPEEAISITLEAEKLAAAADVREIQEEPRTLTVSQILSLYREKLITRDLASTRLEALGYEKSDISFLFMLSEPRPEAMEINRDLISAAAALYREGLMAPAEFRGRLRKAGLSETDINAKVEAEELRYRLDYARDLIAMLKEGYKKDVYTREELDWFLVGYGMQPERAAALVAMEELRKLPKPKA